MTEYPALPENITPFAQPEHQPFTFGGGDHAVLLIHGFPGTPAETRPLGRALANAGLYTHGVLLPGFGPDIVNLHDRSSEDWLVHIEDAWHDFTAGAETHTLIGYSLGGALALNLVEKLQPDRLVLIAPFWKLPGLLPKLVPLAKHIMPEFKPFANADFDDPDTRERFERIMPGIDMDDPEVQERIRTGLTLPMDIIDQVLKMGAQAGRKAHRIETPCLIVQGNHDDVVLPKFTHKLMSRIPDDLLTYQPVAGGHEIIHKHAPQSDTVAEIIATYLHDTVTLREAVA